MLYGFNVSYVDALNFHPWGHCEPGSILVHYNRSPNLMKRRADRAARGEEICGPGFKPSEACARIVQLKRGRLECSQAGTVVKALLKASYGMLGQGQEHGRYPYCLEGTDSVEVEPACTVDVTTLVEKHCLGKAACELDVSASFGFPKDPCPGKFKHLQVVAECGVAS